MKRFFIVVVMAWAFVPGSAEAENTLSIQQISAENYVEIRQKSAENKESSLIEQNLTNENENQALIVQEGGSNAIELTQNGRLRNIITQSSAASIAPSPSGAAGTEPLVDQTGAHSTPNIVQSQ